MLCHGRVPCIGKPSVTALYSGPQPNAGSSGSTPVSCHYIIARYSCSSGFLWPLSQAQQFPSLAMLRFDPNLWFWWPEGRGRGKSEEGKHCPSLIPHLKPLYHLQASLLQGREGDLCRPKWFRELWGIRLRYADTDIPTPRIKVPQLPY